MVDLYLYSPEVGSRLGNSHLSSTHRYQYGNAGDRLEPVMPCGLAVLVLSATRENDPGKPTTHPHTAASSDAPPRSTADTAVVDSAGGSPSP